MDIILSLNSTTELEYCRESNRPTGLANQVMEIGEEGVKMEKSWWLHNARKQLKSALFTISHKHL